MPLAALILLDAPPIIYVLEDHPTLARRFRPLFERHALGELAFAAKRCWATMESWHVTDLTAEIAESAARLRASLRLRLADAVQVASAIAVNAHALVTYDRDFSKVTSLPILR